MRLAGSLARCLAIVAGLAGCDPARRSASSLPPCDEPAAAALDTSAWRRLDINRFPALALPPEFVLDRTLTISACLHGGAMWKDTTVSDGSYDPRFIGWCVEDRMPPIDSPDRVLRKLPAAAPTLRPGDALCALGAVVLGQRMALLRIPEDADSTMWRWYTAPLEHGEPLYLLARSPSRRDEAVVVRALRGVHRSR